MTGFSERAARGLSGSAGEAPVRTPNREMGPSEGRLTGMPRLEEGGGRVQGGSFGRRAARRGRFTRPIPEQPRYNPLDLHWGLLPR